VAGEIEKYKARLVARGFTQIYGIDYYETYAPVARFTSFRLLIAMANRNGWPLDTFDFDSAYLNSVLSDEEEIYLEQPKGYPKGDPKKYVLRLRKALYGLKQGARSWYETLREALQALGFRQTEADHAVFVKMWNDGRRVILGVHVNDCLSTGTNQKLVDEFKKRINGKYPMTDLGPCRWLLGVKVERDLEKRTISLSQHAYIDSILARFNFDDLKPVSMPMDRSAPLSKSQSPSKLNEIAKMKNVPYREAVGSLMYVSMETSPDITFAVSTVAQFLENPGPAHWDTVKHIFRYLKGTRDMRLVYGDEEKDLQGYVDADGASQDHRRAISGYVFMVDGGAVSWMSKKQEIITLSTTEAEYVAATHAAKEAVWLHRLFGELSQILPLCMATINRQSHWQPEVNTMRERSTLTYDTTLSGTLSRPAASNSFTVQPTNIPWIRLRKHYQASRRSILHARWDSVPLEEECWNFKVTLSLHALFPYRGAFPCACLFIRFPTICT